VCRFCVENDKDIEERWFIFECQEEKAVGKSWFTEMALTTETKVRSLMGK